MMKLNRCCVFLSVFIWHVPFFAKASNLPAQPRNLSHPGSNLYKYSFNEKKINCLGRESVLLIPMNQSAASIVVFGHGQALDFEAYKETFFHLAKKGIVVLYPQYDRGFFDRQWSRMASDYNAILSCALKLLPSELQILSIIYSGHSKGAYVASIAASLDKSRADALLLLNTADIDEKSWDKVSPHLPVTIVTSDRDKVIKPAVSERLYQFSRSEKKQFINLKSYSIDDTLVLEADHFWPLTKKTLIGGKEVNALHYFGLWKWLTALALIPSEGDLYGPFIYGDLVGDKGVPGMHDELIRNF